MKKGFTLIELLGVIIIISILALITMPILTNTINQSEEKTYNKQVEMIERAAKELCVENLDSLPEAVDGKQTAILLETLIESGKIQNATIQNPGTKEEMTGCVVVTYNEEYKQYEYKYNDNVDYCSSLR